MLSNRKTLVMLSLIILLGVYPLSALAVMDEKNTDIELSSQDIKKISSEAMTVDLFLARPLGLVATLCGTVVFVVSSPFSALGGNSGQAWDTLVINPTEYTFRRPLGAYDE
jgi:hypothetical protein